MRFIKNRKAQGVSDIMGYIFAFLLHVMMILLFFILFSISFHGCGKGSTESIVSSWNGKLRNEMLLLNYVRTEVSVGGKHPRVADLLSESCINGDYKELVIQTNLLFDDNLKEMMISSLPKEKITQPEKTHMILGPYISVDCNPGTNKVPVEIFKAGGNPPAGWVCMPGESSIIKLPGYFLQDTKMPRHIELTMRTSICLPQIR